MSKPYARRSSSEWQQIIEDQAQSDLSAPQYCQQHGVSYASFSKWRQHFSGTKKPSDSMHSDFIDLSQVPALSGSGRWNITLCLGDGVELRLSRD
jgi:hypothetical protein|tara:strand:- start:5697 stop:5981 length:285 start_codon:yes stop_codon:yes gene_type:complete